MQKLDVLVGCNYPPDDTRSEPGDVITVPDPIAKSLIAAGAAEPHKAPSGPETTKPTTKTTPEPSEATKGQED